MGATPLVGDIKQSFTTTDFATFRRPSENLSASYEIPVRMKTLASSPNYRAKGNCTTGTVSVATLLGNVSRWSTALQVDRIMIP